MAYNGRYIRGLGWALVVLGSLSMILGSAADAIFSTMQVLTFFHYASGPIWSGVFVVVTGILGIFSGKHPTNKCLISGLLVLSIFTILSTATCIGLAGIGTILDSSYCYTYTYSDDGRYTRVYCDKESIALHVAAMVLALAELVTGFVASIMSCCGLAAPRPNETPIVIYAPAPGTGVPGGQGGYIIMQTGVPVNAAAGTSQQQFAAGIPMYSHAQTPMHTPGQVHAQAPPPYMQTPGPVDSKTPV
ncbi:membrane-spanning 4-domains subfamily A member 8-like [Branchiostoma floridae x Branchiostoma japonicum]